MQLTNILSAALLLPLLAFAQDAVTTSGTTTATLTSTLTKTVTLSKASSTITMTLPTSASASASAAITATGSYRASASGHVSATGVKTGSSPTVTPIPGVNELGNGAAALARGSSALAGLAGMLVVALM